MHVAVEESGADGVAAQIDPRLRADIGFRTARPDPGEPAVADEDRRVR